MKTIHFFRTVLVVLGYIIITPNNNANAQNTFQKTYGNGGQGNQIIQTKDSNYAVVGTLNNDVSLLIIDKWGNKILSKTYGGTSLDEGNAIVQTADGNYFYLTGTTMSFVNGIDAVYLLKVNATNGNLIWSKSFEGNGTYMNSSEGCSVELTENGGCIFSGKSSAFGTSGAGIFITKTDANGNVVFSNVWSTGVSDNQTGTSIRKTSDGGYIVCANGYNTSTSTDLQLLKIDSIGNEQWVKAYGGIGEEYGFSVKETLDHGFIAVGYTEDSNQSLTITNVYVVRTDSVGDTLWTKNIGTSSRRPTGYSVEIAPDGFVIRGRNSDYTNSIYSNFITKIDENGNVIWSKNIQSNSCTEILYSVITSSDGGYMLAGQQNGTIYVAKADSSGDAGCNETDAQMVSVSPATVVTTVILAQLSVSPIVNNCATVESSGTTETTICSSDSVPIASNVAITGTPYIGQTLTGSYTYSDVDGDLESISTFRWLCNNVATGDTGITYTVKVSDLGKYIKFEVTPVAQTGELIGLPVLSAPVHIIPDGIEEFSTENVSIYPNPAKDYIVVVGAEKSSLKIFNTIGKLVLEKEINSKEEKINVNDLSNGLYFVKVEFATGGTQGIAVKKFIKQ